MKVAGILRPTLCTKRAVSATTWRAAVLGAKPISVALKSDHSDVQS